MDGALMQDQDATGAIILEQDKRIILITLLKLDISLFMVGDQESQSDNSRHLSG